jgi:hypothetical protein
MSHWQYTVTIWPNGYQLFPHLEEMGLKGWELVVKEPKREYCQLTWKRQSARGMSNEHHV